MREKFQRFMQGRYGADELSRFLTMVGLILIVVNLFFRSVLLSYLVLAILIYCYYRMFSRNYSRRYAENQKFLSWRSRLRLKPSSWKREMEQRRYYHTPGHAKRGKFPAGGSSLPSAPHTRKRS